jgi:hypothetical protein
VRAFGSVGLADVHQHQNRAEEQARRIGQVLSGAARCAAVNRFEHRNVFADVGATGQTN